MPGLPHAGCGLDSRCTRVKPYKKELLTFLLLDYYLEFYIRIQRETSIGKSD